MLILDRKKGTHCTGMLPQLLMAAVAAHKLNSLKIMGSPIQSADLYSLAFLDQLQQLAFENCSISGTNFHLHDIHYLSGLQSLQVSLL